MSCSIERWQPVLGFPGYEAGDRGSVASARLGGRRALRPWSKSSGHLQVHLCQNGRRHARSVHVLVLEAFIGPRPDGMEACHNNGVPSDNRLENLRWDTHRGNLSDCVQHGTSARGERNWKVRLTRESALAAIRMVEVDGLDYAQAGALLGVSQWTVGDVIHGRTWGYVTGRQARRRTRGAAR